MELEPNNDKLNSDTIKIAGVFDGKINSAIDNDRLVLLYDSTKSFSSAIISLLDTLPISIALESDSLIIFNSLLTSSDTTVNLSPFGQNSILVEYSSELRLNISAIPYGSIYRINRTK